MKKEDRTHVFLSSISKTWQMLKCLAGKKASFVLITVIIYALLICYQTIFQPYMLTQIYGTLETNRVSSLYTVCTICGFIVLLFFVLSYFNNVYLDLKNFNIKLLCTQKACEKLFMLPFDKINQNFKENELVNRIDSSTMNLITILASLGLIFSNTVSMIILFSMFSSFSYILIIISVLLVAWGIIASRIQIKYLKKYEMLCQEHEDTAGGVLYDAIHEISFLSMFGCGKHLYGRYEVERQKIWNTRWKQEKISMLISSFTSLFSMSLRGILGTVLFPLHKSGTFSANNVASSFSIYDKLNDLMNTYIQPFTNINTQFVNVKRLDDVLQFEGTCQPSSKAYENDLLLKAENIRYSFDKKIILNDITLEVKKHEKIAVIGRSGCGKSTLLRILAGLYHGSGTLTIDSNLLRSCRDISYIPSSTLLYAYPIYDNILMAGDGAVDQVLSLSGFDVNEQLLDKLATTLSGGQAQRVNIARGLIHKTPLLLADEPVSGLSIAQGEIIIKNIIDASETTIIVTHDPAHLKFFSRIVLLEDGKITASGTLDEISLHPAYARWSGEVCNERKFEEESL